MIEYFLLGLATGMRAMTPIAVLCWCAVLGLIPQHGWAAWSGYLVSAIVFTVMALGEYVGDTLPRTPSRKAALPAISRVIFGALCGALAASSVTEPIWGGILIGALGALVGTWGGYWVRMRAAGWLRRDLPVALFESALALAFALFVAYEIHKGLVLDAQKGVV